MRKHPERIDGSKSRGEYVFYGPEFRGLYCSRCNCISSSRTQPTCESLSAVCTFQDNHDSGHSARKLCLQMQDPTTAAATTFARFIHEACSKRAELPELMTGLTSLASVAQASCERRCSDCSGCVALAIEHWTSVKPTAGLANYQCPNFELKALRERNLPLPARIRTPAAMRPQEACGRQAGIVICKIVQTGATRIRLTAGGSAPSAKDKFECLRDSTHDRPISLRTVTLHEWRTPGIAEEF